jgi:23S rRNA pseudouridine2604 synthase
MAWTGHYTGDEPVRINKWLAQSGVCSRREAEGLIAGGLVEIDGEVVTDAGRKIQSGQTLVLSDGATQQLGAAVTVLMHKPMGYVSGQPEPGKIPAARLLTEAARLGDGPVPSSRDSLPPIGRLDEDSRGLLILSTDGVVAKAVIGPDADLPKTYQVWVRGTLTESKVARLRFGLSLDGRNLKRAEVEQIGPLCLRFVLREGRNRQIRRMCEMLDLRVMDLWRTHIGPLSLDDLPEGRWRHLTAAERSALVAVKQP